MGRVCLLSHQILPKCPQLYWSTKGFHHLDASILESRVRQTCLWDPAMTDLAQRITLTQPSINPAFPPHNSVRVDSGGFSFWCPSQEVAHQGDIPQQVDIPTTGFLHKGEALQSRACLSQRQHSLSDLPSAMLYQASFALMNASRHDRCIWIDARVSLARATLGILHKRKKYSGAHLRHCNSLRSCRWIYIYIYIFFPCDVRKISATTEAIILLQRKLCSISVGSPIPPKAKHKRYFLPRRPHSFCFITAIYKRTLIRTVACCLMNRECTLPVIFLSSSSFPVFICHIQ